MYLLWNVWFHKSKKSQVGVNDKENKALGLENTKQREGDIGIHVNLYPVHGMDLFSTR